MVGIVIVSHSHTLAQGVREMVMQIGQGRVPVATAGGLDEHTIGTNPDRILQAIRAVWSPDGVLVLVDLGSAILSAEMALEGLSPEERPRVALSSAALVEGAVAAAALIAAGASLEEVAAEAQGSLQPKIAQLGSQAPSAVQTTFQPAEPSQWLQATVTIENPLGLHARPAALFVQKAAQFQAEIKVRNASRGTEWVNARSLNAVTLLDAQQGHQLLIEASGPQARDAVDALAALVQSGFGETDRYPAGPPAARQVTLVKGSAQRLYSGVSVSPGVAIGPATFLRARRPTIGHSRSSLTPSQELQRLEEAIAAASSDLQDTAARVADDLGSYSAAIFEVQLAVLRDPDLLLTIRRDIFGQGLTAEAAWDRALTSLALRYRQADSHLLRARAIDIEDLRDRLLRFLAEGRLHQEAVPLKGGILLVQELSPSLAVRLSEHKIKGVCSVEGGPTSHAALLARSLTLPMIVGLDPDILTLPEGTTLAMDALEGLVAVAPDDAAVALMEQRRKSWLRQVRVEKNRRRLPAQTIDGHRVVVAANAANLADAQAVQAMAAEGIGLLRTEFLFLDRNSPPSEEEQVELYTAIVRAVAPYPVIIRTLDVGGDKPPKYLDLPRESNPFLGLRGLRVSLKYPELFKTQLRAILRSATYGPVKVMFPMVATETELLAALDHLEAAKQQLRSEGLQIPEIEVGIMLEVPSAAIMADRLARYVDFFSIGTNDLVQYVMAAERGNATVADLADPLHPAMLRMLKQAIEAAHHAQRWVGMCGEMAAIPEAVPLLLGLGLDEFSVALTAVPTVKAQIRRTRLTLAQRVALEALNLSSAQEVRLLVRQQFQTSPGA